MTHSPRPLPCEGAPSEPEDAGADRIFAQAAPEGPFQFDAAVARVFPDMLRRSIPGYETLLELIGVLAGQVVQPGSRVYDLGCSLGAVSLRIQQALCDPSVAILALDNSEAMIQRLRAQLPLSQVSAPIEAVCADVTGVEIKDASLVVLNFTLQFVDAAKRQALLDAIGRGLRPGGVLVLSEKTQADDPVRRLRQTELHDAFRRAQGYSQLELARKRQALENVLLPESEDTHERRLKAAGLTPEPWFRCLQFVSWLAIKP